MYLEMIDDSLEMLNKGLSLAMFFYFYSYHYFQKKKKFCDAWIALAHVVTGYIKDSYFDKVVRIELKKYSPKKYSSLYKFKSFFSKFLFHK